MLLDADINAELEGYLKAVGFRVEFATRVPVNIRSDRDIVRYARKHRYILIRHDRTKDKKTRLEVFPEVYRYGGKIIQISGDTSQDPLTALGKVLAQREGWKEFFTHSDGIVVVHRSGIHYLDKHALLSKVQGILDLKGMDQVADVKPLPRKRQRKAKRVPPDQATLPGLGR